MTVFKGIWDNIYQMCSYFEIDKSELSGHTVLIAVYDIDGYDGTAFVLMQNDTTKELFEVWGNHCSCFGLEGQWQPEETSVMSLKYRMEKGNLGKSPLNFENELLVILTAISTLPFHYVVVGKKSPTGYFTDYGYDFNFKIDLPNLYDSICVQKQEKIVYEYIQETYKYPKNGKLEVEYIINPEISEWYLEGTEHEGKRQEILDNISMSRMFLTRLVELPCKRLSLDTYEDILNWMKEFDAKFEPGTYASLTEREFILVGDKK